jgi:LDH2 family malate/lactate/ureidoglycolate dehydrogenase
MQAVNRTIKIKVSKSVADAHREREDNEPLSEVAKRIVAKKAQKVRTPAQIQAAQERRIKKIEANKPRVLLRTEERSYGTTSIYIKAGMEAMHEEAKKSGISHLFEDNETPCHRCGDFEENHHKNGGCKSIIPLFSCKCSSCAHCDKFAFAEMMKTPAQKKAEERAFRKGERAEARYWGY